jgi:hypothetical protein
MVSPEVVSPEVVSRMVALVRSLSGTRASGYGATEQDYREACEIAALLPEPVDPDLLELRRIASENSVSLTEEGEAAILAFFKGDPARAKAIAAGEER